MTWGESEGLTESLLSDPHFGALLVLVLLAERFLRNSRRSSMTEHSFAFETPWFKIEWKQKSKRR